jgi:VanZ family protein
MKGNKNQLLLISLILVFIGITVLSLLPPKSGVELGKHDKVNHFIAYAVLSFNYGLVVKKLRKHLWGLPFLIAYGLFMEFCQGFVPGREQSFLDALANSLGVLIGFLSHWIFLRNINKT